MNGLDEISAFIDRVSAEGVTEHRSPRVALVRFNDVPGPKSEFLQPVVCLVTRGSKIVTLGGRELSFTSGTFMVSAVALPIVGRIVEVPYRAIALRVDPGLVADMADVGGPHAAPSPGFSIGTATADIVDAFVRLAALLVSAQDAQMLSAGRERELVYRVLASPLGPVMRQLALSGHTTMAVSPAIRHIRQDPAAPFSVAALAETCNVSEATLFRQFRRATGMTPVQYQKQLRLQLGRRLLLAEGVTASKAAKSVGYVNPAQFARDYRRLFGCTPGSDSPTHSTWASP